MKPINLLLLLLIFSLSATSQVLTREDSLSAGLTRSNNTTALSGYGQVKVEYDFRTKTTQANLTRNVLFPGHRFSNTIYFFSEMELEDARVIGGKPGGELSMEQLFLKFNINRDLYLQAGLFIPRIGLINENHLPTTFNGNDRTYVETFIIPSTWRVLGLGLRTQTDVSFPEISNQVIFPFTDMLVHDMGPALADHRPDFDADGFEWRTSPLWGIGLTRVVNGHQNFLHDGRARTLMEAIMWHGGEASQSKEFVNTLAKADRDALIKFLESL